MQRLDGKVALITGAGGGQGAEEARLFAREGAAVAVCDIQFDAARAVCEAIVAEGGAAVALHLDVADAAGWQRAVDAVMAWRGRLDVLVNNAGIILRTGVAATPVDRWRHLLDINLTGAFLGIQTCAPHMKAGGHGGSVINISSIAGLAGYTDVAYSASKWGLRGLTKSAAIELADDDIRVNAICPGLIVTPLNEGGAHLAPFKRMIPLGRAGTTDEVASLALFLASDDARYITGADIAIDGGFTAGAAARRIAQESRTTA
ncbi:MAG: cyclopentanol dehydrogenase [Rhodoferax sp.]|nr:cyclopentanol dehydrogenase [Rhodoferax sp.]